VAWPDSYREFALLEVKIFTLPMVDGALPGQVSSVPVALEPMKKGRLEFVIGRQNSKIELQSP
jgi:hypothetical protein